MEPVNPVKVLMLNCDKLVNLDEIKAHLFPITHDQYFAVQIEYFDIDDIDSRSKEMSERSKDEQYDIGIFAVHANESRLSINEKKAGIGYAKIYNALREMTGDRVVVIIAYDSNYKDPTQTISLWARFKISSQFSGEYVDGPKGFVLSWQKHPEICHKDVIHELITSVRRDIQECVLDMYKENEPDKLKTADRDPQKNGREDAEETKIVDRQEGFTDKRESNSVKRKDVDGGLKEKEVENGNAKEASACDRSSDGEQQGGPIAGGSEHLESHGANSGAPSIIDDIHKISPLTVLFVYEQHFESIDWFLDYKHPDVRIIPKRVDTFIGPLRVPEEQLDIAVLVVDAGRKRIWDELKGMCDMLREKTGNNAILAFANDCSNELEGEVSVSQDIVDTVMQRIYLLDNHDSCVSCVVSWKTTLHEPQKQAIRKHVTLMVEQKKERSSDKEQQGAPIACGWERLEYPEETSGAPSIVDDILELLPLTVLLVYDKHVKSIDMFMGYKHPDVRIKQKTVDTFIWPLKISDKQMDVAALVIDARRKPPWDQIQRLCDMLRNKTGNQVILAFTNDNSNELEDKPVSDDIYKQVMARTGLLDQHESCVSCLLSWKTTLHEPHEQALKKQLKQMVIKKRESIFMAGEASWSDGVVKLFSRNSLSKVKTRVEDFRKWTESQEGTIVAIISWRNGRIDRTLENLLLKTKVFDFTPDKNLLSWIPSKPEIGRCKENPSEIAVVYQRANNVYCIQTRTLKPLKCPKSGIQYGFCSSII